MKTYRYTEIEKIERLDRNASAIEIGYLLLSKINELINRINYMSKSTKKTKKKCICKDKLNKEGCPKHDKFYKFRDGEKVLNELMNVGKETLEGLESNCECNHHFVYCDAPNGQDGTYCDKCGALEGLKKLTIIIK